MQQILFFFFLTTLLTSMIESKWAVNCPDECKCNQTVLSAPKSLSFNLVESQSIRYKQMNVRTVTCTINQASNAALILKKLPEETQKLLLIQGESCSSFTLSDKSFRHLPGLISLDIQGIGLPQTKISITSDSFKSKRKLQDLRLRGINLTSIDSSMFNKLTGLKILYLVDVGLHFLPSHIFRDLPSLYEISLENNDLEEIASDAFAKLPNLRILHLARNRLRCHDNCTGDFPLLNLQFLDLSNNQIGQMSSLTFLPMPSLTILHLKDNPIQVIFPYAFQATSQVKFLSLGHRRQSLNVMPLSFAGLNRLESLTIPNIDNNVLEPGMFAGLSSLKTLNVRGRIQQITGNAFSGAYNLHHLSVRDCRLRRMYRDAFAALKSLSVLDLSHNRLAKLNPSVFWGLKNLRELHLQHNQLDVLPRRFFSVIPNSVRAVRLEGNPWNCTCDHGRWKFALVGRVRKESNSSSSLDLSDAKYVRDRRLNPLCQFPEKFRGQQVMDVLKKQLKCFKKKYNNP